MDDVMNHHKKQNPVSFVHGQIMYGHIVIFRYNFKRCYSNINFENLPNVTKASTTTKCVPIR
jgi:hypothetical protein